MPKIGSSNYADGSAAHPANSAAAEIAGAVLCRVYGYIPKELCHSLWQNVSA